MNREKITCIPKIISHPFAFLLKLKKN
jgi:hypothetical protein